MKRGYWFILSPREYRRKFQAFDVIYPDGWTWRDSVAYVLSDVRDTLAAIGGIPHFKYEKGE